MKKYQFGVYAMMMIIILVCSCDGGNNDEEMSYNNSSWSPGVYGQMNKRIISWADISFFYYENGGIDSINTPRDGHHMDGRMKFSPDQTRRWVFDHTHSWRDYTSKIAFNEQKYISSISSISDEYDADQGVGEQFFYYDNNGHLKQIAYKSNDGVFYSEQIIVWENDTITKIMEDSKEFDEATFQGYKFEYSGGKYKNESYQFDGSLLDTWNNDDLESLFILGFFGKGPAYLPTKWTKWKNGKKTKEYTFTYDFNVDGTISQGYMSTYYKAYYKYE